MGVVVAVDLGRGVPVAVAEVDEKDPQAVIAWLGPLVRDLGVEVIVTDDLGSYRRVAEEVGVYQQVCLWHRWRWVGRALATLTAHLPDWEPTIAEVRHLVRTLPPDGASACSSSGHSFPLKGQRSGRKRRWTACGR
jgi:hypothetical protein